MERRRIASLAAMVVAGFATIATSSVQPTPASILEPSLEGSFELSPDAPIAIQRFSVQIVGQGLGSGQLPTVYFDSSALVDGAADEDVRLRVVDATELFQPTVFEAFRGVVEETANRSATWPLTCTDTVCERRFALIAEWADADAVATATVNWRIDGTVDVWTAAAAGEPTATLNAEDGDGDGDAPHVNVATATGEPNRLDTSHRMAQWRVTMRLGEGALETVGWPLVTTATLRTTSSVVEAPGDELAGRPISFIDQTGGRGNLFTSQVEEDVEFAPFFACVAGEECVAEYIVGLLWLDGREGSAVDGGWELEARAIGIDGADVPVTIEVEPAPAIAMATASTSGSLVWSADAHGSFPYRVEIPEGAGGDESSADFRLPAWGIWRATVRSTGSAPLPADFGVNFGRHGAEYPISTGDGAVTWGFHLGDGPCWFSDLAACRFERNLAAGFSEDGLPNGWELTIDWELEVAVGTTDPAGGTVEIVDLTGPASTP